MFGGHDWLPGWTMQIAPRVTIVIGVSVIPGGHA